MTDTALLLAGRTALVTGANRGLGAQFARALAGAGARVILAVRDPARASELLAELQAKGDAMVVAMDVAQPESVAVAFEQTDAAAWHVDIVVNNAGIAAGTHWESTTEEDWHSLFETNLMGANRVAKEACRRMVERQQRGTVIHVASTLGLTSQRQCSAYSTLKAGLVHLTKTMAVDLARYGITVNCIAPGVFQTAIVEEFLNSPRAETYLKDSLSRRAGQPGELDGTLLYLAGPGASYVTGVTIPVDGGNHLRGL